MESKVYNLTNPQKSIWFTEQFYKGTPIENITGCVIVLEKLNLKALQKAINLFESFGVFTEAELKIYSKG